jgi:FkbM family methyltransferase
MREYLTGTLLGAIASVGRQKLTLLRDALTSNENIGATHNDHVALRLCIALCPSTALFVDVGAHIGSVMGEVIRQHPNARVIAIEAIPEKAARLRRRFQTATIHECAVADKCGRTTFFVDLQESGYSSLLSNGERPARSIEVGMSTLDTLLPSEKPEVLKIDVEGAELAALEGAKELVARSRPVIIFESASGTQAKESLWQWFDDRNYAVCVPNRVPHNDDGLSLDGFLECHLYPMRTTDFVAIPRERRAEIRERARVAFRMR